MKKLFSLILSLLLSLSFLPAKAAKIGDIAGEVIYTDISAYINHYPISAYAYDGGMVVVAEDLKNFGFDVNYNDDTRNLNITPNTSINTLNGMGTVYKNGARIGKHLSYALYSDINVYLNGSWIPSCAINGYMIIKLEDLANEYIGTSFTWDNSTRSAKLWLDWAGITEYKPLTENPDYIDYSKYIGSYFIPSSTTRPWFGDSLEIYSIDGNTISFDYQYSKSGHAVGYTANLGHFTDAKNAFATGTSGYGDVPQWQWVYIEYRFKFYNDRIVLTVGDTYKNDIIFYLN